MIPTGNMFLYLCISLAVVIQFSVAVCVLSDRLINTAAIPPALSLSGNTHLNTYNKQ